MSTNVSLGPLLAGMMVAATLISTASVARAFDRLGRWLEGEEETLVVFPTYARVGEEGEWTVPVRAWTYEPERDSATRELIVESLRELLELDDADEKSERFERRIRPFLVDNERGNRVDLEIAGDSYRIGTTAPNGHTTARIQIGAEAAGEALRENDGQRWIEPTFTTEFGSNEIAIPVIEREGLTVVSDIDDTIKVTEVLDREEMLRNTFVRDFRAVDGMAARYRRIAEDRDAAFHYLSASPWQLLPFLREFTADQEFPPGLFHLRQLRVKSISSPLDFVAGSTDYKVDTLEQLLDDFPDRDFVLVGDSGEHDPEVYGRVAANNGDQIRQIWIREVDGADNDDARFADAFSELPEERWATFDDPSSLELEDLDTDSDTDG